MKKLSSIILFIIIAYGAFGQQKAPENLTAYRNNTGNSYTFQVTGASNGRIWGGENGVYTDDSHVATAAVHSGLLKPGETGTVRVTILPGKSSYPKITRWGITSNSYGSWHGSYELSAVTGGSKINDSSNKSMGTSVQKAPENLTAYRNNTGNSYTFQVTGASNGRIWGGENGVYTDDSHVATAAVHSGLLKPGETGTVRVTILPGKSSYPKITRWGITSNSYGSWHGSYKLEFAK